MTNDDFIKSGNDKKTVKIKKKQWGINSQGIGGKRGEVAFYKIILIVTKASYLLFLNILSCIWWKQNEHLKQFSIFLAFIVAKIPLEQQTNIDEACSRFMILYSHRRVSSINKDVGDSET
jgi:hypothetical protein